MADAGGECGEVAAVEGEGFEVCEVYYGVDVGEAGVVCEVEVFEVGEGAELGGEGGDGVEAQVE